MQTLVEIGFELELKFCEYQVWDRHDDELEFKLELRFSIERELYSIRIAIQNVELTPPLIHVLVDISVPTLFL